MTDNSSDTPKGVDTGLGEPSMEDILASIRRIIAEDEEGERNHFDVDAVVKAPLTETAGEISLVADAEPVIVDDFNSAEDEDVLILDQLVDEAGLNARELTEIETDEMLIESDAGETFNPVSSVVSELEGMLNDKTPVQEPDAVSDDSNIVYSIEDESTSLTSGANVENDILNFLDDPVEDLPAPTDDLEEFVLEDLIQDPVETDEQPGAMADMLLDDEAESDLDIVKSLMADLADTSFLDEQETPATSFNAEESVVDQLTESLIVEDKLTPSDTVEDEIAETLDAVMADGAEDVVEEDEQDLIINDILELAIQDEEESVTELEDSINLALDDELTIPEITDSTDEEGSLLLQIAAEAEAEADAMGGSSAAVAAVVANQADEDLVEMVLPEETPSTEELLSELDLALAEVTQDDNQELVIPDPEPEFEPVSENTELFVEPEEIEDMPRTARKDAIINEVTEEATADAFAELSQAVEEKAVFTESGPRIGDLVQDALRPMLQEWLDENLKGIVERAVAKEVKRIASGK